MAFNDILKTIAYVCGVLITITLIYGLVMFSSYNFAFHLMFILVVVLYIAVIFILLALREILERLEWYND